MLERSQERAFASLMTACIQASSIKASTSPTQRCYPTRRPPSPACRASRGSSSSWAIAIAAAGSREASKQAIKQAATTTTKTTTNTKQNIATTVTNNAVTRRTRKAAYGNIGDQLDLLYKDLVAGKLENQYKNSSNKISSG